MKYNKCFRCDRKFVPVRSDQMYCSKRCRLLYYKSVRDSIRKDREEKDE